MPLTTFSIGRDTQLVIMGPTGRVDLSHVIGFESHQVTHTVRVNRIDGTQLGAELPRGWEGNFEIERGNSNLDDFVAATEQQYYDGTGTSQAMMYQYVTEPDGSTSTYQYDGVVFRLANAGIWKGDVAVRQKLEFFSARRRRL